MWAPDTRQLRESGAYLRPVAGARATIRMIFTGRTLADGELVFHSRCAPDGQLGLFRAQGNSARAPIKCHRSIYEIFVLTRTFFAVSGPLSRPSFETRLRHH